MHCINQVKSDTMTELWINKAVASQQSLMVMLNKVITQLHLFSRSHTHTCQGPAASRSSTAAFPVEEIAQYSYLLFTNSGKVSSSAARLFFNKQRACCRAKSHYNCVLTSISARVCIKATCIPCTGRRMWIECIGNQHTSPRQGFDFDCEE